MISPLIFTTFILIPVLNYYVANMAFNRFPFICSLILTGMLLNGPEGKTQIPEQVFPMFIQQASIPDIQDVYGSGFRDLNGDGRIGSEESVYILEKVAQLRE